ncbi:hypothetical protein M2475_000837 [Breznakia sp. PF5-3]|uniref:hypothetical protein n=1 Tax=unclassified Breznakia TaxID=2623764 RepID=UPI0024060842|nr:MULTISPECIES: hypothetical protein [unclassified Breznakia]MDF9824445.1 hypothetical protein [Breznakia sp. PM6-1]MDF9835272.1 hypothetical protein [Breznakia sp. PF5-3]MDF9837400.1 hypothetical protein [Breznakia sp. PFB2-8]MDF9859335.1 hypothetical protein [Breznakia sp. PH5-24]
MFITIVGIQQCLGIDLFRVGANFQLEKDPTNIYDEEAICVKNIDDVVVGYVANSVRTVAKGCRSAGRIYDFIEDNQIIEVRFIVGKSVIAEIRQ